MEEVLGRVLVDENLPWPATFEVVSNEPLVVNDVENDIEREQAILALTLENVEKGIAKLQEYDIPYIRPVDYFAEMLKSDDQIGDVKDTVLQRRREIAEMERKKRERDNKKYGKHIQAQREQDKAKDKREHMESLKQLRRNLMRKVNKNVEKKSYKKKYPANKEGKHGKKGKAKVNRPGKRRRAEMKTRVQNQRKK